MADDQWGSVEGRLEREAAERAEGAGHAARITDLRNALDAANPWSGAAYPRLCEAAGIATRQAPDGKYQLDPPEQEARRLRDVWIDRLRRLAGVIEDQGLWECVGHVPEDNAAAVIVRMILSGCNETELHDAIRRYGGPIARDWTTLEDRLMRDGEADPQAVSMVEKALDESSAGGDEVHQYVTLDQLAAIIGRSKRTLERWQREKTGFPMPDIEGGGGKAHEWRWDRVRPWLIKEAKRDLPERFPADRVVK